MQFGVLVVEGEDEVLAKQLRPWLDVRLNHVLRGADEALQVVSSSEYMNLNHTDSRVCVVRCDGQVGLNKTSPQGKAIQFAIDKHIPIFPIVDDLTRYASLAPSSLKVFNGFQYSTTEDISDLGNLLLERMELLRSRRKVFISYARLESRAIALQLHEYLTARWYQVFLDTHTVRPGVNFQESLMQELADSDIMVLLDTPGIKERPWVMEEIAFADRVGLGMIQVVWPNHKRISAGQFSEPIFLQDYTDIFVNPGASPEAHCLHPHILQEIVGQVAQQRMKAYRIREQRMVGTVADFARLRGWNLVIHLGRYLVLDKHGKKIRIETMLGFPDAHRIQQALERDQQKKVGRYRRKLPLLYNSMAITNAMSDHLDFLENGLGNIQLVSSKEVSRWIEKI